MYIPTRPRMIPSPKARVGLMIGSLVPDPTKVAQYMIQEDINETARQRRKVNLMHIPSLARCRLVLHTPDKQVGDRRRAFNAPPIPVLMVLHTLIPVKEVGESEAEH
ncbi:hypothetical protein Pyn_34197 [Prunus yedoensis var. nudiflora]|uniref:Uncharacterized protein n=1 Tax=Prunus yedoensis var. nudiflora TaxID=2094558 RepID=A0A314XXY9_PRUYE|nr:hypothetical protein Pyn_34197 [Prunus yedoensis var. nudiflora]